MNDDDRPLIIDSSWSQARFVEAAKALRPRAWRFVERLKIACAIAQSFPEWEFVADAAHERLVDHA